MHETPQQPPAPAEDPRPLRVRVITRQGCHLCEAAEKVVADVCAEVGVRWEAVDIDTAEDSDDLFDEHGEEIPVTFVDGEKHDFWRVDPGRLTAALTRGR